MHSAGTPRSDRRSEMNTPVRLLPVVQCMNNAGGPEPSDDAGTVASTCRTIVAIIDAPDVKISTNAATVSWAFR